ncbi:DUF1292 domain-containing protein [Qiania dongpingensis]|uniref:DUF1292 domain-containing protein n=1 Tax=Qiania dongpingensis TaxID=2763669 RepID=A0A7G9G5Y9_9FIRM|nr:DUF1292 domain-containing protein [Qiania dongpingensis]QNM06221.1 DUF1292 domain-containing protein [Qiania dongpingensis]
MEEMVVLTSEDGEKLPCYVLEETRVAGCDYVLVTDSEEGDGECYILKDVSKPEETEALYEIVEDEKEQQYLAKIFNELLEDVDIE